jgi:exodeoxyribonuclease VIII
MRDIMLDIETLSTENNALMVSISAIEFCLETGEIGNTFECYIDVLEQAINGADISKDTLKWWSEQSKEAKDLLTKRKTGSIVKALNDFNSFAQSVNYDIKNIRLWGNGSSFDNVILRNAYKRHNINLVLPFWCDTDMRTLVSFVDSKVLKEIKFEGTKHHGLSDCAHQIKVCHRAWQLLTLPFN